ncbi:MAG: XamI family restriction endonuclease [Victivallaceae bacterium]|nr:XamI family restriction endonuclease [Victivallaceae bacterium]
MATPVNNNKTNLWKHDVLLSVDFYNDWFLNFAPKAYREARNNAIDKVDSALIQTANFSKITDSILKDTPEILSILRMATAPPIARDRLVGLAGVSKNLVTKMEEGELPNRISELALSTDLKKSYP